MEKIEIDIDKLMELEITPEQYVIAWAVFTKDKEYMEYLTEVKTADQVTFELYKLYQKGFLNLDPEVSSYEFEFDKMKITTLFDDVKNPVSEFDEFMEKWYALWPKGIKTGGYAVRSGLSDCKKKMKKFMKEHKEFSSELIYQVTQIYVNDCKTRDYDRMQLASYFINKDGRSTLDGACEYYLENPDKLITPQKRSLEERL